jgi:hypothetical protein
MGNIQFLKGVSTSIRFSDRTNEKSYKLLNSPDFINFNAFVEHAINSQVIIDQGSTEEKLKLLGLENILELLTSVGHDSGDTEEKVIDISAAAERKEKIILSVDEEQAPGNDGRPGL